MNIIVIGPQGSGKGTQADLLSKKLGIPAISAGQLCRDEAAKNTARGKKIKEIINRGELIPNKWVLSLILKRISKPDCRRGFIWDGYPRNTEQMEDVKNLIEKNVVGVDAVFLLKLTEKEALKRLASRRQCSKCMEIYNLETKKPKESEKCDKCGSLLVQREDDTPAAIKKRLQIYRKDSKPVISYFRKKKLVISINAGQPIDSVFKDIMKELQKIHAKKT